MASHALLAAFARVLVAACALAPLSSAQGGYTTERFLDLGLIFPRARNYEAVPLPPREEQVVLLFAEKSADEPRKEKSAPRNVFRPEMNIVWLERAEVRTRSAEGGPSAEPPPPEPKPASPDAAPAEAALDAPPPIETIEEFARVRLGGARLGASVVGREVRGYKAREFTVPLGKDLQRSAWIYAYENGQRTIAVVGVCTTKELVEQIKIWRYTAEHFEIREPEGKDTEKLHEYYARRPVRGVEFRIGVRQALVRGWKAEDTENYIVAYDTTDEPLVKKIVRDLELLRLEYVRLFPPAAPVEAVSAVRICKSRDEYLTYGGPPTSAGYWNWVDHELVLYDAETVDKQHRTSDADTFVALYHEAFHQFIHYSCGELPPHSWFNEGHGDYFSGAVIKDGKVRSIGVNPWRIGLIQGAIRSGASIPWSQIVHFEQAEYYDKSRVAVCYAQGWSMIYFLRTADVVARNPSWARILPAYFDTLKSSYAEALATLAKPGGTDERETRAIAGSLARKHALEAAFIDVDFAALEEAWSTYTLALPAPKRR